MPSTANSTCRGEVDLTVTLLAGVLKDTPSRAHAAGEIIMPEDAWLLL